MDEERNIMGLFRDETMAVSAIHALKKTSWNVKQVHSPIPSSKIAKALAVKPSRVGYFTLVGGIIGFFAGFFLATITASQWQLIVSGKPVVALVPFFIVGFEFTILFAIFGNVAGLIYYMRLPNYQNLSHYDPRCSGDRIGIVATCPLKEAPLLLSFFTENGAETRTFK